MWTLYRVNCLRDKHVYIGISQKPFKRILNHSKKDGSKFTAKFGVKSFVLLKEFESEKDAKKAEHDEVIRFKKEHPDFNVAGASYTTQYGIDCRMMQSLKFMRVNKL